MGRGISMQDMDGKGWKTEIDKKFRLELFDLEQISWELHYFTDKIYREINKIKTGEGWKLVAKGKEKK